jgi:hypothetical protein
MGSPSSLSFAGKVFIHFGRLTKFDTVVNLTCDGINSACFEGISGESAGSSLSMADVCFLFYSYYLNFIF